MKGRGQAGCCVQRAFSLIELLVVMAIIGVLGSLLLGALASSRFKGKVALCTSQYRQWGVAANVYAVDDGRGRLPTVEFPLASASGYRDLAPWFVASAMGPMMWSYGIEAPFWFCPARPHGYRLARATTRVLRPGASSMTLADLTNYWGTQARGFAVIDHSWWVPRPLAGSPYSFPDPRIHPSRSEEGWPTKTEDPAGAIQPILSDASYAVWNDTRTGFDGIAGGHPFPPWMTRNLNVLFVDGRVETRGRPALQWQVEAWRGSPFVY